MTDNIDTPQSANPNDANTAFDGPFPTEDSNENQASVEEAFFGSQESNSTTEEASPQEGTPQPTQAPIQEQAEEYSAKNDEKRFEYWQSQAAQRELSRYTQFIQNYQLTAKILSDPIEMERKINNGTKHIMENIEQISSDVDGLDDGLQLQPASN